jgi:phosphohistidine phosphatase
VQLETVDWLVPDAAPLTVVKHLSAIFDTPLLLVSHQPLVGDLVSVLVQGEAGAGPALPTAALAELDLPLVAAGFGALLSVRHAPDYADAAG